MENHELEQSFRQLRKELRMTRIFCVISALLTAGLLVGGVFVYKQIQPVIEMIRDVQPVIEQLSSLDIEGINEALEQVNGTLDTIDWQMLDDALGSIDWQGVTDSLSRLDVDAINSAIEGLDIDGVSEAIENLNNAADVLEGLGEKFSSFGNLFGN